MTSIARVLEACLYAADLDAAEQFYVGVLGLERYSGVPGRHVFFRCGDGMFLVFNAEPTSSEASIVGGALVPTHGAAGPGHVAFAVPELSSDLDTLQTVIGWAPWLVYLAVAELWLYRTARRPVALPMRRE